MSLGQAVRLSITGRVQGVGYRAWLHGEADSLGVHGWVRNRRDGAVEALLVGSYSAVDALIARSRRGPRGAVVERVEVTLAEDDGSTSFAILDTA